MERESSVELAEPAAARARTETNGGGSSASLRTEALGLRDELAEIGESIKRLQAQLGSLAAATPPPDAVLQKLWSLLWQLRPFLLLCSPATVRQWPSAGSDVFALHHRRHYVKDAAHVAIALRLYVVLLRFTVICPAAALHGCLTLLGVLAVLHDPRLRAWKDSSERVLDVLTFVLRAVHSSDAVVFSSVMKVMRQILAEVTTHFDETQAGDDGDGVPAALYVELRVPPTPSLVQQAATLLGALTGSPTSDDEEDRTRRKQALLDDVFSARLCVETAYEARCIQAALLQLHTRFIEQKVLAYVSRDDAVLLCDVACHLISGVVVEAEGGVVNRVHHDAAWSALRLLTSSRRVRPHTQGPLLLTLLTAQWHESRNGSVYDVTAAESAVLGWLASLDGTDVRALVLAMDRSGGSASLTATLAEMWEIAVRWCVELYTAPATDCTAAVLHSRWAAMTTLTTWVDLCENVFAASVYPTGFVGDAASLRNTAEYQHCLQLLVNEVPVSTITASLLCTQLPVMVTEAAAPLLYVPHRILSFFNTEGMAGCVLGLLEKAKDCVDASAYRLLDANALAVLCKLSAHTSLDLSARCGSAAFGASLGETIQLLHHHETPAYGLLLQAVIVLLQCSPPANGAAADWAEPTSLAGAMQELETAIAARLAANGTLGGVDGPLWFVLYQSIATALFRAGSGLSWCRKTLSVSDATSCTTNVAALEALLCRLAGVAGSLQAVLARALWEACEPGSGWVHGDERNGRRGEQENGLLQLDDKDEMRTGRLRRAYEGMTILLSVALQLFAAVEAVLRGVLRNEGMWRPGEVADLRGQARRVTPTCYAALSLLLQQASLVQQHLVEAKYVFAPIAGYAPGPPARAPQRDAAGSRSPASGRGKANKQSPKKKGLPGARTALVVDVDDDDEEEDNDGDGERGGGRGGSGDRRDGGDEGRSDENGAVARGAEVNGSTSPASPLQENATATATSKTQVLERLVEVHRTHVLPSVLTAVEALVFKSASSGTGGGGSKIQAAAAAVGEPAKAAQQSDADGAPCSAADSSDYSRVCTSLLCLLYSSTALAPPTHVGALRRCFSLSTVRKLSSTDGGRIDALIACAVREMMLWTSGGQQTGDASAGQRGSRLFIAWLTASDAFLSLLNTKAEALDPVTVAAASKDVLHLLWLTRRCYQKHSVAAMDSYGGSEGSCPPPLSCSTRAKQEACLVSCQAAVHEARGWLAMCYDLYTLYRSIRADFNDAAVAVMGLCIETARDVMTLLGWSATDLLRFRERPFVFSSFLKAVVDKEDREMKVVLTASLDVLGRYLLSSDDDATTSLADAPAFATTLLSFPPGTDQTRTRLRRLTERESITEWSVVAGALAYVLYECSGKAVSRQMQCLAEVVGGVDKTVRDVPALVRASKHIIAFHLVSLEADAQLRARDQRRRSGRDRRAADAGGSAREWTEKGMLAARLGPDAQRLFVVRQDAAVDEQPSRGREEKRACETKTWVLPDVTSVDSEDDLDGIAFSVFERALEQMVTLCESTDTVPAVEGALRKPVGRMVAAEELWKSMFAVLDSIYKAIRIEPTPRYSDDGSAAGTEEGEGAAAGSLRTRRRWLLGLASFIRFMGPQTTPIALMLPTLLERCARLPSLVPFVCLVWKELVCACTEEYLAESAPSIALSLVSLERHAAPQAESRRLLASALQQLYRRTESSLFWDAYKVVLGTGSDLVALLLAQRKLDEEFQLSGEQDSEGGRASGLIAGFVEVMRSGSLQSTTVFVRALYEYLSRANTATRLHLSAAAARRPEVVQTLLRCSEADTESAVHAMRCISILGAVTAAAAAPATANALRGAASPSPASESPALERGRPSLSLSTTSGSMAWSGVGGGQALYLDAETVLNWRKFAFTLLREYFPHVFASTADPVLHNCIAFAVQELIRAATTQERLQHKGVKLRSDDVVHVDELERYIWWARLTPHVKQLLGGFTTTRYSLTVNWKTRLRTPEFTPGLSYRRWLFNFFNHLVVSCEGWFAEMVQPLRNVAKRNSSLILYLLPYLVVHLLESGKLEDEQYLECEMKTVLEAMVSGPNNSSSNAALSLRSQSLYEAHPEATPLDEPREHAHTVLSILEDVEQLRWSLLRNRGRIVCVFDQQEPTESACLHLSERYSSFLRPIPWTLRCRAALKIGSHIRALRSIEGQRRIPDLASAIQAVPLQRIFAALGDRESSRSIHRATPGLSLEDTAFSFENNGDWLAALGSAELVLQHRPHSGQHQLTALHCMNELGELYMTSRFAASLLASPTVGSLGEAYPPPQQQQRLNMPSSRTMSRLRGSTTFSQLDAGAAGDGAGGMREEDSAKLRSHVQAYANEAAWRLGQWDTLLPDSACLRGDLPTSAAAAWTETAVSLAMPAAFLHRELTGRCALPRVRAVTDVERLKVVPMVRTPCQEDLTTQGYTFTLLLHALGDVDAVSELLCTNIAVVDVEGADRDGSPTRLCAVRPTPSRISASLLPNAVKEEIVQLLSLRAAYVEDTISAREPLLSLHRMIYRELNVPQKVAETWLKQSELLRNAGLGEAALTAARQAAYECPKHIVHTNYYTLVANLLHDTQSATPAMEFARECVADPRIPATTRARLQMLLTNWLVETGSERPERVFAEYDKARELDRSSELVHHQMAVFYDHLHTLTTNASEGAAAQLTSDTPNSSLSNAAAAAAAAASPASAAALYSAVLMHQREMVESIRKYAVRAIVHFGEALLRGTEKASVSLPRMLTLWLDSAAFLGSLMATTAGKLDGTAAAVVDEVNGKVRTFVLSTVGPTIPPGVVMTALPQLLSRLAHPVASVRVVLTDIVLHLLSFFPQQCLWLVLPMALSKEGPREIVETQIIKPFADLPRNERVLRHAKIICDTLLTICNCSASLFPKEQGLTQLSPVQKINPMLADAKFILPVLSNLTPDITADEIAGVFPTSPCFDHFEDRVMVMRSLQKPKRIWVATNEGREMSFLCKSKDEPRKDIRMMEVVTLMNSFFLSDPEAKRKRFSLRRYSVTALSDDCAVIEWLNDTTTLSRVATDCYVLDRSGVHVTSVKKWLTLVDDKKISRMDLFTRYILPEAPPVMHQWLDRTFTSNQGWYEARNLFTQSTALWSIAGHIVGLGDRHAENLMLDMERGELMHVDFACMFDKGEMLEVPEQVRFRLTQNLTDVMGVLGAYGPFQATCEVALRCEMKNKSAVMSIVETLMHEPLVEWRRQSSRSSASNGPKQLMERVARRLDGFLDLYSVPAQRDTLALNVESQVSKLIHHSSDMNNLSQMYIWWMAWI